jgi:hypothetical protein
VDEGVETAFETVGAENTTDDLIAMFGNDDMHISCVDSGAIEDEYCGDQYCGDQYASIQHSPPSTQRHAAV